MSSRDGKTELGDIANGMQSLRRSVLHKGSKFDYEEITLRGPNGKEIKRQVIRHPGAVVILPLLERLGQAEVVFVRNLRAAIGGTVLELPAGTLEKGEPPIQCAARELEEETGFRAATLTPLGRFYTGPGLTDELMHAFLGTDLKQVGQRLEPDEELTVETHGVAETMRMIESGKLMDAKSIAAMFLAVRRGVIPMSNDDPRCD